MTGHIYHSKWFITRPDQAAPGTIRQHLMIVHHQASPGVSAAHLNEDPIAKRLQGCDLLITSQDAYAVVLLQHHSSASVVATTPARLHERANSVVACGWYL